MTLKTTTKTTSPKTSTSAQGIRTRTNRFSSGDCFQRDACGCYNTSLSLCAAAC